MSRRRQRVPTSYLSYWQEHDDTHRCEDLLDAIHGGVYEVLCTTARGRRISRRRYTRRRVLVVVPNHPDVWPGRERLRFCPFCGHRIHLIDAPAAKTPASGPPVVPDRLPEGI